MPLSALRYGAVFIYNTRRYLLVPLESRDASSQSEKKKKTAHKLHSYDRQRVGKVSDNSKCSLLAGFSSWHTAAIGFLVDTIDAIR